MFAERAQFQLEHFTRESFPFDTLLRFLFIQRHLLECTYLTRSLEARTTTQVRGQEILCIVQTLSTTASLLLHPQLDATSLRRLEYIGDGQSSREGVRVIEEIYHLGPRLRSLRFMWGGGKTETFRDVTKFFRITTNTPMIKHIYLSDTSRNVSDFHQASPIFAIYTRGSVLDIRAVCYNGV